jgi:hypothetical protein
VASITEEAERIRQCKGRVFALHDEPEVPRVWLPFDDAPGLAMARAFGDFCLKDYGVIAVPELSHRLLTDQDQFIVLATDGVRLSKTTILFLSTESCHCYLSACQILLLTQLMKMMIQLMISIPHRAAAIVFSFVELQEQLHIPWRLCRYGMC